MSGQENNSLVLLVLMHVNSQILYVFVRGERRGYRHPEQSMDDLNWGQPVQKRHVLQLTCL